MSLLADLLRLAKERSLNPATVYKKSLENVLTALGFLNLFTVGKSNLRLATACPGFRCFGHVFVQERIEWQP
jgi:sulfite reductase beta subunit-like hemoprotein